MRSVKNKSASAKILCMEVNMRSKTQGSATPFQF